MEEKKPGSVSRHRLKLWVKFSCRIYIELRKRLLKLTFDALKPRGPIFPLLLQLRANLDAGKSWATSSNRPRPWISLSAIDSISNPVSLSAGEGRVRSERDASVSIPGLHWDPFVTDYFWVFL